MIVIFVHYCRGETTSAAIRLADLAKASGASVRFVSTRRIERPVHPYWDNHVRIFRTGELLHCRQAVWFDYDAGLQQLLPPAQHFWVPSWRRCRVPALPDPNLFRRIVCCCRQAREAFLAHWPGQESRIVYCPWDAGVDPVRRHGSVSPGRIKVYIPMGRTSVYWTSLFMLGVLEESLNSCGHLTFTVDSQCLWDKESRRALRQLVKKWPERLNLKTRSTSTEQLQSFHEHDWTFVPNIQPSFGLAMLRSLACSTPVLAYDIPPADVHVAARCDPLGIIPCSHREGLLGVPIVVPPLIATVQALQKLSLNGLMDVRAKNWGLEVPRTIFERFWRQEFGID